MTLQRVAIFFDDQMRPETTGVYCRRALGGLVEADPFRPSQLAEISFPSPHPSPPRGEGAGFPQPSPPRGEGVDCPQPSLPRVDDASLSGQFDLYLRID